VYRLCKTPSKVFAAFQYTKAVPRGTIAKKMAKSAKIENLPAFWPGQPFFDTGVINY